MEALSRSEEHTSELQSHSDLHSFPTRRSSDLRRSFQSGNHLHFLSHGKSGVLGCMALCHRAVLRCDERCRPCQICVAGRPCSCCSTLRSDSAWHVWKHCRDRKSTRLNSSHTVIYTLSLHDALPISGGHFNPAITFTFYRMGKVEFWDAWLYVIAQFLGAMSGVALAKYVLRGALAHVAVRYAVTVPGMYGSTVEIGRAHV